MIKLFIEMSFITSLVLMLQGCTTPGPTYKNLNPSPLDAELSFESDFELHTHFSVNTSRGTECGKYETVGYLLKTDSVFIYDKPNREIKIAVPTERPIGVAGYHFFSDPTYKASCYPKGAFFTPLPNEKYVVKMNKASVATDGRNIESGFCFISIHKIEPTGERPLVKPETAPNCKK